jgi:hypothetical protein
MVPIRLFIGMCSLGCSRRIILKDNVRFLVRISETRSCLLDTISSPAILTSSLLSNCARIPTLLLLKQIQIVSA